MFFLRTLLCSNDVFNPRFNRKRLIRKRTSILDIDCFIPEQLFYLVQCTACKLCHCRRIDILVLPRATGILSTLDQPYCLWGSNCFGNGTRKNWDCPLSVFLFTQNFFLRLTIVHFRQEHSSLEIVF